MASKIHKSMKRCGIYTLFVGNGDWRADRRDVYGGKSL